MHDTHQVRYQEDKTIDKGMRAKVIHGKVVSGLGEGKHYITIKGYLRQFNQKLGFEPYPGTLNIELDHPLATLGRSVITINGFRDKERTFGGCKCCKAEINGIEAAIIRPNRSKYPASLVEIIAQVSLRKSLDLADGDEVEVILE